MDLEQKVIKLREECKQLEGKIKDLTTKRLKIAEEVKVGLSEVKFKQGVLPSDTKEGTIYILQWANPADNNIIIKLGYTVKDPLQYLYNRYQPPVFKILVLEKVPHPKTIERLLKQFFSRRFCAYIGLEWFTCPVLKEREISYTIGNLGFSINNIRTHIIKKYEHNNAKKRAKGKRNTWYDRYFR
jgi:hypothetical protein